MSDILAKLVILLMALIAAGGAKYALQSRNNTAIEIMAEQAIEKVAEEVIKEETGIVVDLEKPVDGSNDLKQN